MKDLLNILKLLTIICAIVLLIFIVPARLKVSTNEEQEKCEEYKDTIMKDTITPACPDEYLKQKTDR